MISKIFIITKETNPENIELMSDEDFIKIMNSKERVISGLPTSLKMHYLAQRAIQFTTLQVLPISHSWLLSYLICISFIFFEKTIIITPITINMASVISWQKTVDLIVGISLHDFPLIYENLGSTIIHLYE